MPLSDLGGLEGWRVEGIAARVHYRGADDRFSVEYYDDTECVVYWQVHEDEDVASPIDREWVPSPLRAKIREDLAAADIEPDVERARI